MAETNPNAALNFEDKVVTFVSDPSFRYRNLFPSREEYQKFVKILKGDKVVDCKVDVRRYFCLISSEDGDYLCSKAGNKKIMCYEDFCKILYDYHNKRAHGGRDVTVKKIKDDYHYVPHRLVQLYINDCSACQSRRSIPKPVSGMPIYAQGPMNRVQVDCIDMRSTPDGDFKWIVHAKCHYSKFTWARALPNKECKLVAEFLKDIFHSFGPSKILQCDNGGEFIGNALSQMLLHYFPSVKKIHSAPRHPQTNGLIERANGVLEQRLSAFMYENGNKWADGLSMIVYEINTSPSRTIKDTAFNLMFLRNCSRPTVNESSDCEESSDDSDVPEINENESDSSKHDNTSVTETECSDQEEMPYVLYETDPPKIWSIAFLVNQQLPGLRNFHQYKIVKVIADDPCYYNDEQPLELDKLVNWPKINVTSELGKSLIDIQQRIPSFLQYLNNRYAQNKEYCKKKKSHPIVTGDVVALPIPRVDRSNTCPKNLPCQVIEINDQGYMKLQCMAGVISKGFHQDKATPWVGKPPDFSKASADSIALIPAYRSVTNYSKTTERGSVCRCKTPCDTKRCVCKKNNIPCSTKCHPNSTKCSNSSV